MTDTIRAVAFDQICSQAEADWVCRIARERCIVGSGYDGDQDPMGNGSTLRGVRVSGPPAYGDGMLLQKERNFLVELIYRMRVRLEPAYKTLLQCGYASLTLREATPDVPENAMAHPWHADHDSYGERDRWRTHTAVLHLNAPPDFAGGVFCMPNIEEGQEFDPEQPFQATAVQPMMGRMVGFDAHQVHGVTAVTAGTRITLVGWFGKVGTIPYT